MTSHTSGIKEVLIECIEASLSPNGDIRRSAEERLKALEVTEYYGTFLLEIVLESSYPPPTRLLAGVLLRQYVDTHWTKIADKFVPPEASDSVKDMIRKMAPLGLLESQSKIRKSIAAVISAIAHWDWPEQWPDLFNTLMTYLRDVKGIQGAMSVMTEFVKELTDQHMKDIAPIILPEAYRIISEKDAYPTHIRAKAVYIFRTCARMIATMAELDKNVLPLMLDPMLPAFMGTFAITLNDDTQQPDEQYSLKKEIVKTIANLIRLFPKRLSGYLPDLLSPIWGILTSSTQVYKEVLTGTTDEEEDSDGQNNGVEAILYSIFDLVQNLIGSNSKLLIKPYLADLIYYTIFYMQLPQEKVEAWISQPSSFASDEDEEAATYSLRVCAQDLLTVTCDAFKEASVSALGQAVNKHLSLGGNDWRIQEACLFAVCTLGTNIVETRDKPGAQESFDIHGFVQNVVIPGLSSSDILLVGRCIVLGSNFSSVIEPGLTQDFVRAAAECLQPDRSVILRILAVKAITTYITLSSENDLIKQTLLEVLPAAIDSLIHFGTSQSSTDILSLVLECLIRILTIDEGLTASVGQKMTTLSIACFVKFNGDPIISPTIEELVRVLCKNPACAIFLRERFVPTITSVLNNTTSEAMAGPQGVALDILNVIVRASPVPLCPALIQSAFPAVVQCVNKSDDNTVLQNGGECLRAFTALAPDQVYNHLDSKGISGLQYVVQIACRLLDPSTSEFTAACVGKLVTTLICKAGDKLGEQLELLLRAVLSKLQSAETLSVIQNLCMVYAHLFNTQMPATLSFLESVPGPSGQSALNFVMTEWVSRQHMFFGHFDRKVCAIALSKLLIHSLNYPPLAEIEVKGEQIFDTSKPNQVQTRSKKNPEKWTVISLPIKIFKLLINELAFCSTNDDYETEQDDAAGGDDSHIIVGDDDASEDGSDSEKDDDFVDDFFFDNSFQEDADIANDIQYAVKLEDYLKEFFVGLSQQPCYPQFVPHINRQEQKVLKAFGINC